MLLVNTGAQPPPLVAVATTLQRPHPKPPGLQSRKPIPWPEQELSPSPELVALPYRSPWPSWFRTCR